MQTTNKITLVLYKAGLKIIEDQKKVLDDQWVASNTDLKIGDYIMFTERRDWYNGESDIEHKRQICRFIVSANGDIYVNCFGLHYTPILDNCIKIRKPRNFKKNY